MYNVHLTCYIYINTRVRCINRLSLEWYKWQGNSLSTYNNMVKVFVVLHWCKMYTTLLQHKEAFDTCLCKFHLDLCQVNIIYEDVGKLWKISIVHYTLIINRVVFQYAMHPFLYVNTLTTYQYQYNHYNDQWFGHRNEMQTN